jgi:hypothetical protein
MASARSNPVVIISAPLTRTYGQTRVGSESMIVGVK